MDQIQVQKVTPPHVRYLSERAVAEMTGIPVSTLQKQRHTRTGLPYSKFGKLVRYALSDVVASMEACRIRPAQ